MPSTKQIVSQANPFKLGFKPDKWICEYKDEKFLIIKSYDVKNLKIFEHAQNSTIGILTLEKGRTSQCKSPKRFVQ